MLGSSFRLHLRDRFDFSLEDQESIMVEIDSTSFEQSRHFGEI